ncbi:MAG: hemolysin-type calcium-binding region [Proteobacteria bacterium]|nr:hemolysin-type calcium-binding region [Pseudomonadota bacterium]
MALQGTFFNATYYLTQYADVAANWSGSALAHYTSYGAAEGRVPNSWFNAQYYRANAEAAVQSMTALQAFTHYEAFGYKEGRAVSSTYATFDEAAYLATYSDLGAAGITTSMALNHYLVYGANEGRIAKNDDGTTLAGPTSGQTFALTTGTDNITGTGSNDTITGYINTTTATVGQSTLNGSDIINGGSGTDTLNLTVEGANAVGSLTAAAITNVEKFYIRDINTSGASTYNFATIASETHVYTDRSTQAVTFSSLGTGTTVGLIGDGTTLLGNVIYTMATATDAGTISIDGGIKGTPTITRNQTGASAVTITSTGAANVAGAIDLDTGTTMTSLTINATTALTTSLVAADYAATATLTISGAGLVNLSGAALAANIATINAANSTGGVSVIMGSNASVFTGGSGNDTVSAGALVFSGTGTLNGGAGTDTIALLDAAQYTSTTIAKMTNFETLRIDDDNDGATDTFDASLMTTLTGLHLTAQSVGDGAIITNMSSTIAGNVAISGDQAVGPNFGVTGATTVGQLDTLTIGISDGAVTTSTITVADITAAGVETFNITATDNFTLAAATGMTAMTNVNLTGAGNVSITTGGLAINVNSTIDASALTGTFILVASGASTNGLAIKGSSTKVNTITGTNQADVVTGGAANDTIATLNGIDSVIISSGGDDIVAMNGLIAAANRVNFTGFTAGAYATNNGADRLEMADADATFAFAAASATFQAASANPTATLTFNTAAANVLELSYEMAGNGTANDLDSHTDGTGLLAAIGQTVAVAADTNKGYILAYQDGKAYLYNAVEGADVGADLAAADIALVGVFSGVTAGAFDATNFIDAV